MSVWWEDWAGKGGKGASHRVHGMADMTFAFFPSPTDPRVQMMKHTKHDIVHSLCALPKTQHDFSSFEVDICFHTVSTCFLLGGEGQKGTGGKEDEG